eukprot:3710238-Rhodomonas_salina.1
MPGQLGHALFSLGKVLLKAAGKVGNNETQVAAEELLWPMSEIQSTWVPSSTRRSEGSEVLTSVLHQPQLTQQGGRTCSTPSTTRRSTWYLEQSIRFAMPATDVGFLLPLSDVGLLALRAGAGGPDDPRALQQGCSAASAWKLRSSAPVVPRGTVEVRDSKLGDRGWRGTRWECDGLAAGGGRLQAINQKRGVSVLEDEMIQLIYHEGECLYRLRKYEAAADR